jgi:hypothetical protein
MAEELGNAHRVAEGRWTEVSRRWSRVELSSLSESGSAQGRLYGY